MSAYLVELALRLAQGVSLLPEDLKNLAPIVDVKKFDAQHGESLKALARALTPTFWKEFDQEPLDALEFLENEVGPTAISIELP